MSWIDALIGRLPNPTVPKQKYDELATMYANLLKDNTKLRAQIIGVRVAANDILATTKQLPTTNTQESKF